MAPTQVGVPPPLLVLRACIAEVSPISMMFKLKHFLSFAFVGVCAMQAGGFTNKRDVKLIRWRLIQ